MKKLFVTGIFIAVAGFAAQASAQVYDPSYYRCYDDQLPYSGPTTSLVNRLALGRYHWADASYKATGSLKYWDPSFNAEVANSANTYNVDIYPVYAYNTNPYPTWVGPGTGVPSGDPRWANTYVGIKTKPSSIKPNTVELAGLCESGCYMPDQVLEYSSGPVAIVDAMKMGKKDLITLHPDSTFDSLKFITNDVLRYTTDRVAVEQEVLTLQMQSGGEIKVSMEHPLLTSDGIMKAAKDLAPGDSLMREDGSPDPIVTITENKIKTKVYNVRPVTTDLVSNILIAQGYLNGSARYQNEFITYLNKVLLRQKIPADVIPKRAGARGR
jgi:hypothetical protein